MGSMARQRPALDNGDVMALTEELVALCHRDEPDPGPDPRQVEFTESTGRMLRALCFYAEPEEVVGRAELPSEEVASILARACGHIGSGAEYLYKTVVALEALGIRDPHLWQLQNLVATEIKHSALTLQVSQAVSRI